MNNNQNRDLGWRFETDRDQGRERGRGPERGWGGVGSRRLEISDADRDYLAGDLDPLYRRS